MKLVREMGAVVLGLLLGACGSGARSPDSGRPTSDSSIDDSTANDGDIHRDARFDALTKLDAGACLASQPPETALVVAALAQTLSVSTADIQVVCTQEITWPDGCLGLPAPELCAPGVVPGYLITLEVSGQQYTYHTSMTGMWRLATPIGGAKSG